ncbi:phenylalanine--tRNA ligase subunit alpha [Methanobrevibacter wolinii]|uniref:phenylalanine--tRNA ligase subunit alpha n=1 Tax=Methanobrevibacter wolinii TaxID=190977 RepID=UPI0005B2D471|nr:phenylalanine--tRNA ligase subunit alpha [Methanobrevibacter wolinii]
MSEDILKIINELSLYEKILLKDLGENENILPEEIAEKENLNIKSVMSAAGSLSAKNIITVNKDVKENIKLTDAGKDFAEKGLPERRILSVLGHEKKIPMGELAKKSGLDKKDVNIALGWLNRKHWAKINKGVLEITDDGVNSLNTVGDDEKLLKELFSNQSLLKSSLNESSLKAFKDLNQRKNLIKIKKITSHSFELNDLGINIINQGFDIDDFKKEATQLTHDDLKSGAWKSLHYKPYDINAENPKIFPGKVHPLRKIIQKIREIFLDMGFTEADGTYVDSAFWNFDSLFQPQDHAAREMQDTFYLKNPCSCKLPDDEIVKAVAKTHEDGGNTTSTGWGYDWDVDVAKQSVLRTHTTGISTKYLANHEPPLKMFSVGRVFRRETINYKHLPEFHQVEGIVAAPGISFEHLLGILKEFYKKLGFEVRFRPAYFPYTYMSCECEIYLEERDSWIELGGSGMFRPEVLEPLGIDVPVLAFGIGVERLAMITYDISDIRMLYKSDIKWLRDIPIDEGVELDSNY